MFQPSAEPTWEVAYGLGYSDGHNVRNLRGGQLAHYAYAYADICDEERSLLDLAQFFTDWSNGVYEGTAGEHWYRPVVLS